MNNGSPELSRRLTRSAFGVMPIAGLAVIGVA